MAGMRIEGRRGFPRLNLQELWVFRELLALMVWRDLRIRYKQTVFGLMWAILPTLFSGLMFSIIFGRLAGLGSDGLPYPAFYFAAVVPWNLFASILNQTSICLTSNTHLLNKVYFPRLVLPLKTMCVSLVDSSFASLLIVASMVYYGLTPTANVVWLPFFVVFAVITGLGLGLWFATLNAYFRDIGMVLPYVVQIWFFLTPIFYPASLFPEPWRTLQRLNPMASVAGGFRWSLLGVGSPPDVMAALSFGLALLITILGAYFFRRVERNIVDVI